MSGRVKTGAVSCYSLIIWQTVITLSGRVKTGAVSCCNFRILFAKFAYYKTGPSGLTFTWWGCCGSSLSHKPTELPAPFYSVLVSVSVFMAISTVFHSINSPDNSTLSYSILLVLILLIGPFIYVSLYESLPQP